MSETPANAPAPEAPEQKPFKFYWYYATRAVGLLLVVYGLLGDKTPERSTIILTGAGLLGIDKVARSGDK